MVSVAERRPLLLGHRGCRTPKFCENSIAAFEYTLASGCDGFEFDVRQTADGKLVCVHDDAIRRHGVAQTNYGELCKQYLKSRSGPERTDIAILQDVLERFSDLAFLNIELKIPGMEKVVVELLEDLNHDRLVVSSFLVEVICRIAEIDADIPLGYIFDSVNGLKTWPSLPARYVVPPHDLVSQELVAGVHKAGRKLVAWTVNRPQEMRSLAELGVDGIISDDPKLLSETLGLRR